MTMLGFLWLPIGYVLKIVENLLFLLINWYDAYCYTPLQIALSPLVARIPRWIEVRGHKVTVFTANIVSWSRTALVIPIAWCLKYNYPVTAFVCVLFHDFLDHLDGIVAKVQKSVYGQLDDPLLGGFMDAFCDKIVNCVSLWTILVITDFSTMTSQQIWLLTGACVVIIVYEFILGVVRVQDYFKAYYERKHSVKTNTSAPNLAAVMEGKLKEKLESLGIGCLCLAQANYSVLHSTSGTIGMICLLLSVRLAHASLEHKLKPRREEQNSKTSTPSQEEKEQHQKPPTANKEPMNTGDNKQNEGTSDSEQTESEDNRLTKSTSWAMFEERTPSDDEEDEETSDEKSDVSEKYCPESVTSSGKHTLVRRLSVPTKMLSSMPKVDKVYTVGCFDLFHDGHRILLERLSVLGKQVIVGVHDSRSIFKLKKRVPIDSTTKRMANVNKFTNVTFCIHGTDPTPYLRCMYDADEDCTSMYVRGDDMQNFPARKFIESVMPIHFLPYSNFISSTKIRKEVYNASMFGPHVSTDESHDHSIFY